MEEHEESLADIETLWLKDYVKSHKEKSEEVEKLIHKKVEKYVTEEGYPNKGINKEEIIREMENIFFGKTIAPVIEQRETAHGLFVKFLESYKALVLHRKGAKMEAEELSKSELKKVYNEITAKEKGEKNE